MTFNPRKQNCQDNQQRNRRPHRQNRRGRQNQTRQSDTRPRQNRGDKKRQRIKEEYVREVLSHRSSDDFSRDMMLDYFHDNFADFYPKVQTVINQFWRSHERDWLDVTQKRSRYLFVKAFTHSSYISDDDAYLYSYERQEWMGDALLNFLMKRWIYHQFNKFGNQGLFSNIANFLVSTRFYSTLFDQLNLSPLVFSKVPLTPKIKEDMVESFFHALYCNLGMDRTKTFVNKMMSKHSTKWILKQSVSFRKILNERIFQKFRRPPTEVLSISFSQNKNRQFFCKGWTIDGKWHKNHNKIVDKNKHELMERLACDILDCL